MKLSGYCFRILWFALDFYVFFSVGGFHLSAGSVLTFFCSGVLWGAEKRVGVSVNLWKINMKEEVLFVGVIVHNFHLVAAYFVKYT